jgi:hypothetical protein
MILKYRAEASTIHPLHFCHYFKSFKCYSPPQPSLLGPDLACPETNVAFDSEDGRLRSRKQTFSDSTRKDGLETWGSESVPDRKSGTQSLQPCSALAQSETLSCVSYGASQQPPTCPMPPMRSCKQTFSDSTRKVGLETWGSDSVPDHSKGSLAPVKERGA